MRLVVAARLDEASRLVMAARLDARLDEAARLDEGIVARRDRAALCSAHNKKGESSLEVIFRTRPCLSLSFRASRSFLMAARRRAAVRSDN